MGDFQTCISVPLMFYKELSEVCVLIMFKIITVF